MALDHDDQNDRPRFHQPNWAVGGDAYNVAGSVTNNYYPPATAPLSPQQQRDRRTMLAKVRAIWIDGLLDQSLAQALRVELGLTTQPGAVDLALPKLVQELNQPARELPAGTPISAVFGQVGGALLILGAPGAGKTTLLLELARDLLARAEADDAHPIPVVFNLSTWAANPTTLAAWLVDELSQRYDVPRKTAQQWVAADAVLPLLDGLDEVAAAQRNDCVVAINQYHNEQGFVPLAVCSRAGEYSELDYKLRLHNAVLVQPLTPEQVAAYLQQGGDQLVGLRTALDSDKALAELLDTPLLLSIAALAYAGAPAAALAAATPEAQRRQLFDAYITAMYRRRGAHPADGALGIARTATRPVALAAAAPWLVGATLLLGFALGFPLLALLPIALYAIGLALDRARQPAEAFVLWAFALACLVCFGTEIVYIRDVFNSRMNTIFKFYYQVWLIWGVLASYAVWWLAPQIADKAQSLIRRIGYAVGLVLFAVLLAGALVYPWMTAVRQFRDGERVGLDGKTPPEHTPDAAAAFAWLRANTPGDAVVLEAVGDDYDQVHGIGANAVSAATGRATVLGWPGHEDQWRGGDPAVHALIGPRKDDVASIYSDTDTTRAAELLKKYSVGYIYVGAAERATYPAEGLAKLGQLGDVVFQQGDVVIYRVR